MKAIRIYVYKNPLFKKCPNGGITEKYDELLLVCDEGCDDVDEENPPENLVVLVDRKIQGKPSPYIRPYAEPDKGKIGWMSGGAFAYSSDIRFYNLFYGAVAIHDRQETEEEFYTLII